MEFLFFFCSRHKYWYICKLHTFIFLLSILSSGWYVNKKYTPLTMSLLSTLTSLFCTCAGWTVRTLVPSVPLTSVSAPKHTSGTKSCMASPFLLWSVLQQSLVHQASCHCTDVCVCVYVLHVCLNAAEEWSDVPHPISFDVCTTHFLSLSLCLSTHIACLCSSLHARICMCVFAARPQYKRGHRKTASHGTILDIPKIIVTGTGSPGAPSKQLLIREGRHCDARARIGCYSCMSYIPRHPDFFILRRVEEQCKIHIWTFSMHVHLRCGHAIRTDALLLLWK